MLGFAGEIKSAGLSAEKTGKGLLADMEGQVMEAISRGDYYQKWGKHYLPSLARAHQLQQCSNFKDPGVQVSAETRTGHFHLSIETCL